MKTVKIIMRIMLFVLVMPNVTVAQQPKTLNKQQKSMVAIAALTAKGDLAGLSIALNEGLEAGLTINQIKESLLHLYAYAGFPRSIRGLQTFMAVLAERKQKGISDLIGKEASPILEGETRYERGKAVLSSLTGKIETGPKSGYAAFCPEIEVFIKEHLFADIFERDVLSYSERELVTISILSSMGTVEPMLHAHFTICLNVGFEANQLRDFVSIIENTIGEKEAVAAQAVLDEVLNANPYTLVYAGAISKNEAGKVNIHPVTYQSRGLRIAANVYTPADYDPAKKYPAVVVAHPNGGVKEQVSGLYAQRLAEQGYITIVADAAYQGASEGMPRNVDKPANRIEDIHAMADYLSQYQGADVSKIALLGICGGGGYSLKAAQADKRFKAVATLSMFNSGEVRRNGFLKSQIGTIQERLELATAARAQEAAGAEVIYVGTAIPTAEEIAKIPTDLYREGFGYYYDSHAHPNSTFKYTMSSLLDLMTFDANSNMDLLTQPLLMLAGSKADTFYMTEEAFTQAVNARNKELFLLTGATHIQTYWKPAYVDQAVNKLVEFYTKNL